MYEAETGHCFDFENIKAIDNARFKGGRLVKDALHLEPHAVNRLVWLPVQYQAIHIKATHTKVRQVQDRVSHKHV